MNLDKLVLLKKLLGEVADINAALALMDWDQHTYMPRGAAEGRGYQVATLSSLAHTKFISQEIGDLLAALKPEADQMDPDADDACLVQVTHRLYHKELRVPTDLVMEFAQETTLAQEAWMAARAENDFSKFRPHLEKVVELRRRYAALFAPYDHVYDPLLDDFEPGLKTRDVIAVFDALRPQQVELIRAIGARPQVDDSFMHQDYDEQKQWDFGVEIATALGYDWERGRQDKTVHPFTTNFGIDDVRITTRIHKNLLSSGLMSTMHETGHALYELGVDHALGRTPLAGGASMALHESQSRLWENLVGLSQPFWECYYPRLQEIFPAQLENVSLEMFYKGINKVEPSLVRVESDEATYNLHIMLRLELEIALMDGSLAVKNLPEAWNTRMQETLGLTPPNHALGVLQDIHWSSGLIGYFPTYALGNLVSVQLWERIQADIPDLDEQFRRGEFRNLLDWLRQNIHRHGAKYEPQHLVQRVTGSKIDPAPYMRYLSEKYSLIYGL